MNCEICGEELSKDSKIVVCSDKCASIRLFKNQLIHKYFPANGCDNCLSDSGGRCSDQCVREMRAGVEFSQDLWKLIGLFREKKVV